MNTINIPSHQIIIMCTCKFSYNYPHMRSEGYSSCLMCVCVSVTLIPANQAIQHPTKGSSSFNYI